MYYYKISNFQNKASTWQLHGSLKENYLLQYWMRLIVEYLYP